MSTWLSGLSRVSTMSFIASLPIRILNHPENHNCIDNTMESENATQSLVMSWVSGLPPEVWTIIGQHVSFPLPTLLSLDPMRQLSGSGSYDVLQDREHCFDTFGEEMNMLGWRLMLPSKRYLMNLTDSLSRNQKRPLTRLPRLQEYIFILSTRNLRLQAQWALNWNIGRQTLATRSRQYQTSRGQVVWILYPAKLTL